MGIYGIVRLNLSGIMDKKENQNSIINPFPISENRLFMKKWLKLQKYCQGVLTHV